MGRPLLMIRFLCILFLASFWMCTLPVAAAPTKSQAEFSDNQDQNAEGDLSEEDWEEDTSEDPFTDELGPAPVKTPPSSLPVAPPGSPSMGGSLPPPASATNDPFGAPPPFPPSPNPSMPISDPLLDDPLGPLPPAGNLPPLPSNSRPNDPLMNDSLLDDPLGPLPPSGNMSPPPSSRAPAPQQTLDPLGPLDPLPSPDRGVNKGSRNTSFEGGPDQFSHMPQMPPAGPSSTPSASVAPGWGIPPSSNAPPYGPKNTMNEGNFSWSSINLRSLPQTGR